ncbi:MAG: GTP diphosphokinase [Gammaproteobacteria bacterium]|nr:GTP diphosphokinase [Gammaproteobacteria bacterium]MDH5801353.1 GTP diphosphokinase [Gammaproteobacteria bacterium]
MVSHSSKKSGSLDQFDFPSWLNTVNPGGDTKEAALYTQVYALMEGIVEHQQHLFGESELLRGLMVTEILAHIHMDRDTKLATLLYALLNVSAISLEEIQARYGDNVAGLVSGIDKMRIVDAYDLHSSDRSHDKRQLESVRKLLLALAEDVRVVLIKLAERLHIMRNLKLVAEPVRVHLAKETQDIFAPLASRLGVWQIKWELEDLSFRYLDEGAYQKVATMLAERRVDREAYIAKVTDILRKELVSAGIKAEVTGRPKHIYSIWKKMHRKGVHFENLFDVRATRVMVNSVADCYGVLGIVHSIWRPIKSEFDDYIATPKDNEYQSLHTAVIGPDNKTLEIQIRTYDMHQHCEYGVAAHWGYKEGGRQDAKYHEKIAWLRQLLELNEDHDGADEADFIDDFKAVVFEDRVYVLTPKGKVVDLPRGATALDFAYHIHTDVGHHYCGAKVDGKIVTISQELQNGQQVEILTSPHSKPSRDWLNPHLGYVNSSRTRAKIRSWFKQQDFSKNLEEGKLLFEKELHRLAIHAPDTDKLLQRFKLNKRDDLYAAIGRGDVTMATVIHSLKESIPPFQKQTHHFPQRKSKSGSQSDIKIMGVGDLLTKMANCCKPVPFDAICGYITRGQGVTVHRSECRNLLRLRSLEKERIIEVSWGSSSDSVYLVDVVIRAYDRPGLLHDITSIVMNASLNVMSMNTHTDKKSHLAYMKFTAEVSDVEQLSTVFTKIEHLPNVLEVSRSVS